MRYRGGCFGVFGRACRAALVRRPSPSREAVSLIPFETETLITTLGSMRPLHVQSAIHLDLGFLQNIQVAHMQER